MSTIKETLYEYITKTCIGLGQGDWMDAVEDFLDIEDERGSDFSKSRKTWNDTRLLEITQEVIDDISTSDSVAFNLISDMSIPVAVRYEIARLMWMSVAGDKIDKRMTEEEADYVKNGATPEQLEFEGLSEDMHNLGDPEFLKLLRAEKFEHATERQIMRVGTDTEKLNDKFEIAMSRWNKMLGQPKPPPLVLAKPKPIRRQSTMVNGKEGPPKVFKGWGAVTDVQTANKNTAQTGPLSKRTSFEGSKDTTVQLYLVVAKYDLSIGGYSYNIFQCGFSQVSIVTATSTEAAAAMVRDKIETLIITDSNKATIEYENTLREEEGGDKIDLLAPLVIIAKALNAIEDGVIGEEIKEVHIGEIEC
jgi:hypothetical protein